MRFTIDENDDDYLDKVDAVLVGTGLDWSEILHWALWNATLKGLDHAQNVLNTVKDELTE